MAPEDDYLQRSLTDLLSCTKAAERMGIDRRTLNGMIERGQIPFYPYGNRKKIHPNDLPKRTFRKKKP